MHLLSIKKLHFLHCGPINLELKASEIIGLSGASGSGKSLFLRALADLDEHRGDIVLHDAHQKDIDLADTNQPDINQPDLNQQAIPAHEWRQKVALLSAETRWWFDTVEEHFVEFPENEINALGFTQDCRHWSIARLSSGEKQRLGLLRVLQNQPDVLLLDEPTANLDKHNTRLFEKFVMDYLQMRPAGAIWVSHDNEQLQRICQRQYEIKQGLLVDVD